MQKLVCPRGGASHLTFSPDGDLLAALGPAVGPLACPTALYCWTRSRGWEIAGLGDKGLLTGLAVHPAGRTLAFAAISTSLWSAPGAASAPAPPGTAAPPSVWRRRFAKEKPRPFTGVHLYPLTGIDEVVPNRLGVPRAEGTVVSPESWARGLAFTPDGRVLLAAHVESLGFVRTRTNVYHWHFTETDGVWHTAAPVAAVGATERGGALVGGYLALAGSWGVAVCPVESTAGLFVPDVQSATVVAVAPRGELVAVADRRGVSVWSLRRAEPVAVLSAEPRSAVALAFSPDGRTLAVGHAGGTVSVWDAPTGAPGVERDYGVEPLTALAYAPDGLTLAVAGRNGVVVVDTE